MNFASLSIDAAGSATFAFLVEAALKGTALLTLAGLLVLALRRASAAQRHLVWACALGGMVALPVLLVTLPGWRVSAPALAWLAPGSGAVAPGSEALMTRDARTVIEPQEHTADSPANGASPIATTPTGKSETKDFEPAPASSPAPSPSVPSSPGLALMVWAAGAFAAMGVFVVGHLALRLMLRGAHPVRDGEWHALAIEAADRLGLTLPFALLRCEAISVPVAFGLLRPRVLLPAGSDDWPLELRRAVLLHELAHVQRHDCLTQAVAQLACALFWFHPAVWWAAARLHSERERACDDRVLAARTRASDYADHLLGMARSLRATRLEALGAVAFARPSSLEGRLLAVLDPGRDRRPVGVRVVAPAAAVAALLVLPFAALEPVEATTVRGRLKVARHEVSNPEALRPSRLVAVPDPGQPLESRAEWAGREAGRTNAQVWWIGWQIEPNKSMKGNLLSDSEGIDLDVLGQRGYFTLEDVIAGRSQGTSKQDDTGEHEQMPAAVLVRLNAGVPERIRVQTFQLPVDFRGQPLYWMDAVPDEHAFAWLRDAARQAREPGLRGQMVESVGFMSRSELVTPFLEATLESDEDPRVRRGAAEALARHPSPRAARLLTTHAKTDRAREVRRASVEALGHMQTPEALEELLAIARVSEGDARRAAFDAIGQKVSDVTSDAEAPKSQTPREKSEKAETWKHDREESDVEYPDAGPADEPSQPMDHDELAVQRQAIESLGRYPEGQSLPQLRRIAETSPNSDLRAQAVESLGRLGTASALALLEQIVWKNRHERARNAAVEMMGRKLPADRALGKLTQIASSHPSPDTRRRAVEMVGRLDSDGASEALRRFVDQGSDRNAQRQAVESLGRRAGDDIENELVEIARSHRSVDVRRQAVESLGRREGTVDRLMEIARGDVPQDVQRQAVESLGRLDDERVPAMLLDLARNHSVIDVERQAVESLGRIEADVMPDLAQIARSHPSSEVRRQAVESMTRRDPEKALPLLEEILRQPKRKVGT